MNCFTSIGLAIMAVACIIHIGAAPIESVGASSMESAQTAISPAVLEPTRPAEQEVADVEAIRPVEALFSASSDLSKDDGLEATMVRSARTAIPTVIAAIRDEDRVLTSSSNSNSNKHETESTRKGSEKKLDTHAGASSHCKGLDWCSVEMLT